MKITESERKRIEEQYPLSPLITPNFNAERQVVAIREHEHLMDQIIALREENEKLKNFLTKQLTTPDGEE